MKKFVKAFIVFSIFFPIFTNAQDTPSEEYIIKKGDTLWDISNTKLKNPFLWPKLWIVNPQIKNPDLIYPGEKIKIPSEEELMQIEVIPEEKAPVTVQPTPPEIKPPVVKAPVKPPVRYLVDKNLYITSGWISNEFPSIGHITASPNERTIFGKGDFVYLEISRETTHGEKFFVIRNVKMVKHPKTGEKLGYQIKITGILEIVGIDHDVPKARIETAFGEIQKGDGLMLFKEMTPPVVPDIIRTPDIEGYIVESYMNSQMVGPGEVIYLDKGQNDGLQVGDIFSAISETPVKRPIGTIQIISLQPTTSTAIVLKSEQEITVGDKWGKK